MRLFIALPVPAEVRREIGRAQDQLRRCAPPGAVRWAQPDQFHITLKFLGDMPANQLEALKQTVSEVCAGFPVMHLSADGIGFFPSVRKPRVIWSGANDNSGLMAVLHRQIHEAVRPFAPADNSEKFVGHVTLGRFKPGHRGPFEDLWSRITKLNDRHFGGWPAEELEIIRSELTPAGARHLTLAAYPLAG